MCQAQKVFPRYLMSSEGILGCGWELEMPSIKHCTVKHTILVSNLVGAHLSPNTLGTLHAIRQGRNVVNGGSSQDDSQHKFSHKSHIKRQTFKPLRLYERVTRGSSTNNLSGGGGGIQRVSGWKKERTGMTLGRLSAWRWWYSWDSSWMTGLARNTWLSFLSDRLPQTRGNMITQYS